MFAFPQATVCIDLLINTYSSTFCRTGVYPYCKCCKPCAVNEYYYRKKCETIVEPKPTLKYVSFVDEPHIRMVDQQLLGKSLQAVKGQEVPVSENTESVFRFLLFNINTCRYLYKSQLMNFSKINIFVEPTSRCLKNQLFGDWSDGSEGKGGCCRG